MASDALEALPRSSPPLWIPAFAGMTTGKAGIRRGGRQHPRGRWVGLRRNHGTALPRPSPAPISIPAFAGMTKWGGMTKAGSWEAGLASDVRVRPSPGISPPSRIVRLDQSNLPGSIPFLERFFPADCAFHGFVSLVPHEGVYSVTLRESFYEVVLVMPDALGEVGCYSYVECAVAFGRRGCRRGVVSRPPILLDSGLVSRVAENRPMRWWSCPRWATAPSNHPPRPESRGAVGRPRPTQ